MEASAGAHCHPLYRFRSRSTIIGTMFKNTHGKNISKYSWQQCFKIHMAHCFKILMATMFQNTHGTMFQKTHGNNVSKYTWYIVSKYSWQQYFKIHMAQCFKMLIAKIFKKYSWKQCFKMLKFATIYISFCLKTDYVEKWCSGVVCNNWYIGPYHRGL